MAKIDISTIEGYSEMTAEEKLAALEALELPEPDFTGWVKKDALDKVASEAASYKKQLREKMTAEEEKAEREAEERAALQQRVEELERERTIHGYISNYLAMGYEEKLAKATAEALVAGDNLTTLCKQRAHRDVFQNRHIFKRLGDLERSADTQLAASIRGQIGDVLSIKNDFTLS